MPLPVYDMPRERTAKEYYVEIVAHDGTVQKRLGPLTETRADKVDGGVNVNLDHEHFYTRIVAEEPTL